MHLFLRPQSTRYIRRWTVAQRTEKVINRMILFFYFFGKKYIVICKRKKAHTDTDLWPKIKIKTIQKVTNRWKKRHLNRSFVLTQKPSTFSTGCFGSHRNYMLLRCWMKRRLRIGTLPSIHHSHKIWHERMFETLSQRNTSVSFAIICHGPATPHHKV